MRVRIKLRIKVNKKFKHLFLILRSKLFSEAIVKETIKRARPNTERNYRL